MSEEGVKHDAQKDRWDLVPTGTMQYVVKVLTHGARKYADNNWQTLKDPKRRYYAALMRHMDAWRNGEGFDPESKLPHLAHAIVSLLFLLWFDLEGSK